MYIFHSCTNVVTRYMSSKRIYAADLRTGTREKWAGEAMWTMCFQVEPFRPPLMLRDEETAEQSTKSAERWIPATWEERRTARRRPRRGRGLTISAAMQPGLPPEPKELCGWASDSSRWGRRWECWAESWWDGKLDTLHSFPSSYLFLLNGGSRVNGVFIGRSWTAIRFYWKILQAGWVK